MDFLVILYESDSVFSTFAIGANCLYSLYYFGICVILLSVLFYILCIIYGFYVIAVFLPNEKGNDTWILLH